MILKPEEARTKLCPLMSYHQSTGSTGTILCRAEGCMKWRWMADKSPSEIEGRKAWQGAAAPEPVGYCGA